MRNQSGQCMPVGERAEILEEISSFASIVVWLDILLQSVMIYMGIRQVILAGLGLDLGAVTLRERLWSVSGFSSCFVLSLYVVAETLRHQEASTRGGVGDPESF